MIGENGEHVARPVAEDWKQEREKSNREKLLEEHHVLAMILSLDLAP